MSHETVIGPENIRPIARKPMPGFPPAVAFVRIEWVCDVVVGEVGEQRLCGTLMAVAAVAGDTELAWVERVLAGRQARATCNACGTEHVVRRGLIQIAPAGLGKVNGGRHG